MVTLPWLQTNSQRYERKVQVSNYNMYSKLCMVITLQWALSTCVHSKKHLLHYMYVTARKLSVYQTIPCIHGASVNILPYFSYKEEVASKSGLKTTLYDNMVIVSLINNLVNLSLQFQCIHNLRSTSHTIVYSIVAINSCFKLLYTLQVAVIGSHC